MFQSVYSAEGANEPVFSLPDSEKTREAIAKAFQTEFHLSGVREYLEYYGWN